MHKDKDKYKDKYIGTTSDGARKYEGYAMPGFKQPKAKKSTIAGRKKDNGRTKLKKRVY